MKLDQLSKVKAVSKKRMGRGLGSGKGKTGGKGTKGQKARGKLRLGFIGGGLPLYRKLPLARGKGNPKISEKTITFNLLALSAFKSGDVVDITSLLEKGMLNKRDLKASVKILGEKSLVDSSSREINFPLTIKLPMSAAARKKIEEIGGEGVQRTPE